MWGSGSDHSVSRNYLENHRIYYLAAHANITITFLFNSFIYSFILNSFFTFSLSSAQRCDPGTFLSGRLRFVGFIFAFDRIRLDRKIDDFNICRLSDSCPFLALGFKPRRRPNQNKRNSESTRCRSLCRLQPWRQPKVANKANQSPWSMRFNSTNAS